MHQVPKSAEAGSLPVVAPSVVYAFVRACGLRKPALARLRVGDIWVDNEGHVWVNVTDPDGIPIYGVPVLDGNAQAVLSVIEGRNPQELVFAPLPQPLRLQSHRIAYARALYEEVCADNEGGYDEEGIVTYVMHALCEPRRIEVVRRYYLGQRP